MEQKDINPCKSRLSVNIIEQFNIFFEELWIVNDSGIYGLTRDHGNSCEKGLRVQESRVPRERYGDDEVEKIKETLRERETAKGETKVG